MCYLVVFTVLINLACDMGHQDVGPGHAEFSLFEPLTKYEGPLSVSGDHLAP